MNILIAKFLAPVLISTILLPSAVAQPSTDSAGQQAVTAQASVISTVANPKMITETYKAVVTAYTSAVDETDLDPTIAAYGGPVYKGLIACSRAIPFGAKVTLSNGKSYTCNDRKARKNDDATNPNLPLPEFDIWMESKSEAFAWGRRTMEVTVSYSID